MGAIITRCFNVIVPPAMASGSNSLEDAIRGARGRLDMLAVGSAGCKTRDNASIRYIGREIETNRGKKMRKLKKR
jgi:hypothetical protein